MKDRSSWELIKLFAIVISVLVFTPLVIPEGRHEPFFFGFPYTFSMGFLVSVLLVLLTWLGTRHHPGRNNTENDG